MDTFFDYLLFGSLILSDNVGFFLKKSRFNIFYRLKGDLFYEQNSHYFLAIFCNYVNYLLQKSERTINYETGMIDVVEKELINGKLIIIKKTEESPE